MRNTDLISKKLEEALCYLYNNEQKLKPLIEYLQSIMIDNIKKENISVKDAFNMFVQLQEQYTNNILLITKIKEIIDFKDF